MSKQLGTAGVEENFLRISRISLLPLFLSQEKGANEESLLKGHAQMVTEHIHYITYKVMVNL